MWGFPERKLPEVNPICFPGHPGSLLSTWCPGHVKIRYWFANVKQLDLGGWRLVANRAEVWSEPLWRYLSASDCELRVRQRSISCCLPRNMQEWWRDGVGLVSLFIFAAKWAFLRSGTAGGLLTVLLGSHLVFCWAEALVLMASLPGWWHLLQPHSVCLPCLPGSSAEPCGWLLTTVAADTEWLHCKFQGHSPCTHTPLRLVHWRQPQGTACLAGTLKDPSRDSIHTSFRRHPTLWRELGMGLRGIGRRQREGGTGLDSQAVEWDS